MKKALALALAAVLCGCCSVQVCKTPGTDCVEVKNYSWRLFGLLAIASGDPECPNEDVPVWFCDSLLLDVQMMMLDNAMRKYGYRSMKNVSSYRTKESMLFLFSRHCYHTTAEFVR